MSQKEDIGKARAAWREKKAACMNAGAPSSLFGTDDLGPQLDKMQDLVYTVERGKATPQDEKGKKALAAAKEDALKVVAKVGSIAGGYRESAQKALDKASSATLKTALRDAITSLRNCEAMAGKTTAFLRS